MATPRIPDVKAEQVDLPEWVKFALEVSKKIEKAGIVLPSDLAERHDDYARSKPKS